jgi:hypothetical protein
MFTILTATIPFCEEDYSTSVSETSDKDIGNEIFLPRYFFLLLSRTFQGNAFLGTFSFGFHINFYKSKIPVVVKKDYLQKVHTAVCLKCTSRYTDPS